MESHIIDSMKAENAEELVKHIDAMLHMQYPCYVNVISERTGNGVTLKLRETKLTDGSIVFDLLVG